MIWVLHLKVQLETSLLFIYSQIWINLSDDFFAGMSLGLAVAGVGKVTVHGPVGIVCMNIIISKIYIFGVK